MAAGYAAPRRLRSAAGWGHKLAALRQSCAGCSPDPCRPCGGTVCIATPEASPAGQGTGGAFAAGSTGCGLVLYRRRPCRPAPKAAKPWRRKPAPRRGKAGVSAAAALSIKKPSPEGSQTFRAWFLHWRPRCDSNTRPSA